MPWQRLYFLPLPQGQASLRPTFLEEGAVLLLLAFIFAGAFAMGLEGAVAAGALPPLAGPKDAWYTERATSL